MKKIPFIFLFLFLLVASKYSDRYHLSSCKIAEGIPKDELLNFQNPEEAKQAGYVPCKKCFSSAKSTNFNHQLVVKN